METNVVVLFDYSTSEIIRIYLSEKEQQKAEQFEDFEEYLRTLESKFGFRLDSCSWMSADYISEKTYNI